MRANLLHEKRRARIELLGDGHEIEEVIRKTTFDEVILIDPRIKDRPGRIDLLIEVGLVEREDLVMRFLQRFLGAAYREEEHAPLAPTFLKQTGSHMREVCLLGSIHALDQGRADISREDLQWAHETLLHGRALAAQAGRFDPPPARKRGPFFGNKGK